MQKPMLLKKSLVVVVIYLFIGVTIFPSYTANIEETVNIPVKIFSGNEVYSYNVTFTKSQERELNKLIESVKERIEKTSTWEETIEIFYYAIEKFDEYGLFGNISINEIYQLVTNGYYIPKIHGLFKNLYVTQQNNNTNYDNFCCLVTGETSHTKLFGISQFAVIVLIFEYLMLYYTLEKLIENEEIWDKIEELLFKLEEYLFYLYYDLQINVNIIMSLVTFGECIISPDGRHTWRSAKGWIQTTGLLGVKRMNGSFYGRYGENFGIPDLLLYGRYFPIGIIGFKGIFILNGNDYYYMGSALKISLNSKYP